ncbi:MAG: GtrA family protein [Thermodesulfobacteriota bacterium]
MNKKLKFRTGVIQFEKYVAVGILNLFFTLAVYFVFLKLLHSHYLVAYSVSWLAGVLFTYVINFVWVFKPEKQLEFRSRLPKYFIVYISSFLINFFSLKLLTEFTGWDPLIVQMFILPIIVFINFFGMKWWSLRHREVPD